MNKKKKFFASKLQMIVYILVFCLLLAGFIYFGNKDYSKTEKNNDVEVKEIEFDTDNVFQKINATEALSFIKRKNVIMMFGVNNDVVLKYGNLINQVAKEKGIDTIYYYDIEKDREDDNASYRSLVNYLSNYATNIEGKTVELYAPSIVLKTNGNILYYDNLLAINKGSKTVEELFDEDNTLVYLTTYSVLFDNYLEGVNNGK